MRIPIPALLALTLLAGCAGSGWSPLPEGVRVAAVAIEERLPEIIAERERQDAALVGVGEILVCRRRASGELLDLYLEDPAGFERWFQFCAGARAPAIVDALRLSVDDLRALGLLAPPP